MSTDTNPMYWDCECETEYIRKKTGKKDGHCAKCGADETEQPDSMSVEVVAMEAAP